MKELANRILESNFKWLNTNMREIDTILDVTTPSHDIIEVVSTSSQKMKRRVALLGLLTDDPSVYRPNSFGGATIEPVIDSCEKYIKDNFDNINSNSDKEVVDLIIPLTHQRMPHDREYCNKFDTNQFPIVIAGHDHEPFDEIVNGSRIIKVGIDAENTGIIDIKWNNNILESSKPPPDIQVEIIPTKSYKPDPIITERVKCHKRILDELEKAKLFRFDDWLQKQPPKLPQKKTETTTSKGEEQQQVALFSTENNRLGPSNGTTILCSILRMGMRCQCSLINAGSIRRSQTYPKEQEWFTWSDLKAEMPFPTIVCSVLLPGYVIEDMINHSRKLARQDPPQAYGGYIHHCDQIELVDDDDDANENCTTAKRKMSKVRSIGGKAFDRNNKYLTSLPWQWLDGMDNHVPLLEWAKKENIVAEEDSAKPGKIVVVEVFAALLWLELGSFDSIDLNGDGVLTRDEIRHRAVEIFGSEVADLVVDNVFSVADLDQKGYITPIDMMVVRFVASDMLNHVATQDEMCVMQKVASQVLDKRPSHFDVKKVVGQLYEVLDVDSSGTIDREEAMNAIGEVRRRSLLM